jgi:hypothetical protein
LTLHDIESGLPWGFHDGFVERVDVDWLVRECRLVLRLMMDDGQTTERRARVVVAGLEYLSIDPPGTPDKTVDGLWIDTGPGHAPNRAADFTPTPEGCFVHWLFVHQWNSFIHVCGKEASLEWLDPAPVPVRRGTGFALPGDKVDLG